MGFKMLSKENLNNCNCVGCWSPDRPKLMIQLYKGYRNQYLMVCIDCYKELEKTLFNMGFSEIGRKEI